MEPVRDPEERQRQSPRAVDMLSGKSNSIVSDPALDSPTAGYKSSDSVIAPSDVTDDSMVTVPLSGPPSLAIDTSLPSPGPSLPSSSLGRTVETIDQEPGVGEKNSGSGQEGTGDVTPKDEKPRTLEDELKDQEREDAAGREQDTPTPPDRDSSDSVNWDELQKTEHEQKRDSDTVSPTSTQVRYGSRCGAPSWSSWITDERNRLPSLRISSWRDSTRRTPNQPAHRPSAPKCPTEKYGHRRHPWPS